MIRPQRARVLLLRGFRRLDRLQARQGDKVALDGRRRASNGPAGADGADGVHATDGSDAVDAARSVVVRTHAPARPLRRHRAGERLLLARERGERGGFR